MIGSALISAIAGVGSIWYRAHHSDASAYVVLLVGCVLFAACAVLAFGSRSGRFMMEGDLCVWSTAFSGNRKQVLDFREVTTLVYEIPNAKSQRLLAILRDGKRINLPPEFLHFHRDIAEFMDFVESTQRKVKIVGRDLLPRG